MGSSYKVEVWSCSGKVPGGYKANGEVSWWKDCGNKAKDASSEIDIDNIVTECDKLIGYADEIKSVNTEIETCTSFVTKSVLSVNGTGIENIENDFAASMTEQETALREAATKKRDDAISGYQSLQNSYNEQAQSECSGHSS